mmetsp:Transcript_55353/g.161562  ORF Transcript_55353/g.161562 Transcript_55353/m.161562 type:complete len:212 (-) Transcript_55353:46-681(-)
MESVPAQVSLIGTPCSSRRRPASAFAASRRARRPCFLMPAEGSPETTSGLGILKSSSSLCSSLRKHRPVSPTTPRTLPQVHSPQEGSASHSAQHISALASGPRGRAKAPGEWYSTPSSITPQAPSPSLTAATRSCTRAFRRAVLPGKRQATVTQADAAAKAVAASSSRCPVRPKQHQQGPGLPITACGGAAPGLPRPPMRFRDELPPGTRV